MRSVRLDYRSEGTGWAVSSPDATDYIAYAESLPEAIRLAHEGIAFHLDVAESDMRISDFVDAAPGLVVANNTAGLAAPSTSEAFCLALNAAELFMPAIAPTASRQVGLHEAANVRIETGSAA